MTDQNQGQKSIFDGLTGDAAQQAAPQAVSQPAQPASQGAASQAVSQPAQAAPEQKSIFDGLTGDAAQPAKPNQTNLMSPAEPSQRTFLTPPVGPTIISARNTENPLLSLVKGVINPNSDMGGFQTWANNLEADVKNGSDITAVGKMLKAFGAKGTSYGVSPGTEALAMNPISGIPGVFAGAADIHQAKNWKQIEIAANRTLAGAFQTMGPAMLTQPEALAVVIPSMVAQHYASAAIKAVGGDADDAELGGNVAALGTAHVVHGALNTSSFSSALNDHIEAAQDTVDASAKLEEVKAQVEKADTPENKAALEKAQTNYDDAQERETQKKSAVDSEYRKTVAQVNREVFRKQAAQTVLDTAKRVVGVTPDIVDGVIRAATQLGKKDGAGFRELVGSVKEDLTAIFNDAKEDIKNP